ncbi:MAG: YraN family protein [Bernardetiaceae bacterium]|nr:YraN family protein [Bernardetiaceae bacterium]
MHSKAIGTYYENLALEYLLNKGYQLLERNYRYKRSEIDIIASKEDVLVFIEVKFRRSDAFGMPEESVSDAQAERILEAAEDFIENRLPSQDDIRFDIIAILKRQNQIEIKHFEDAFY